MSVLPPSLVSSDADLYRLLRGQIEFEDSLIVQRLNWFVASQSFLFTAYAINLNAPVQPALGVFREHGTLIFHLIPVVALACCALIYLAVVAGVIAQVHIHREFKLRMASDAAANFPRLQGASITRLMGMAAPLGIPIVFAIVWAYLLFSGLHRT